MALGRSQILTAASALFIPSLTLASQCTRYGNNIYWKVPLKNMILILLWGLSSKSEPANISTLSKASTEKEICIFNSECHSNQPGDYRCIVKWLSSIHAAIQRKALNIFARQSFDTKTPARRSEETFFAIYVENEKIEKTLHDAWPGILWFGNKCSTIFHFIFAVLFLWTSL